jgi:hypothetical protein
MNKSIVLCSLLSLIPCVYGDEIIVSENISSSVIWTSDNTYNLQDQIYVLPGATLTIEAGTRIASTPTTGGSGSLAVCRGGKIFANGTAENPIVFTSTEDNGEWRESANEWGNLTLMGNAYISNSFAEGNSNDFGNNQYIMEGLVQEFPGDTRVFYGGQDDEDSSGSLSYVSIRYGGRVVGLNNELNGLSLGGIGRGTDINHIEIMNNVDDGIEIWGGTVNLSHVNIWNVGDDSLDIDQGWRGSAQYGLIVQGFSLDASQGSGVGDNMVEMDGAENSDAQPVTTAQISNFTMIGQPIDGDGATVWRDGARVQFNQCIIMDCGEKVVRPDGDDGDGSSGYGHNGTLTLAEVFQTSYTYSSNNLYTAQVSGTLSGINDSVLYNNSNYSDFNTLNGERDNRIEPNNSPIVSIVREVPRIRGGKIQQRVLSIDPRAASGASRNANGANGLNGFVEEASFRGAFAEDSIWLCGWTAADQYGFIATDEYCEVDDFCYSDFNKDGFVNGSDLGLFLVGWGQPGPSDLNEDGTTNGIDLGLLLASFGPCS